MIRLASTRFCAAVLAGGAMAAVVFSVWPHVVWDEERLPFHWRDQIERAPDEAAATIVRHLAPTGPADARALVEFAASPRAAVAQAAQDRLDEWMYSVERRKRAAPEWVGPAVGEITRAVSGELAETADRLGPVGARWAGQMSRRLLDVVDLLPQEDRVAFIQDCQIALAAVGDRDRHPGDAPLLSRPDPTLTDVDRRGWQSAIMADAMLRFATQTGPPILDPQPPAGAVAGDEAATSNREDGQHAASSPMVAGPGVMPEPVTEQLAANGSDLPSAAGPALTWRMQTEHYARVGPETSHEEISQKPETLDVPSPQEAQALEQELLHAPLASVIETLKSRDRFAAASAAAALRARGMSEIDLKIAQRLPGADAEARLVMLEEIGRLAGATMAAWLHHFATDESSDVRLRALTLLGTSRDEELVRRVRARAIQDQDPRVRALARRLEPTATDMR